MKLLFFGTPGFALASFRALEGSRHEVAAVVCQPDRPAGRGLRQERPPVACECLDLGRPLVQPEKLTRAGMEELFRETGAELGVVVAYGKILRPWMLALAPRGYVNVHASVLPKYRGAAPIARALVAGEAETGVSVMRLDEGMDTGPVYFSRKTAVGPDETAGELEARLAEIGAAALLEALDGIEAGTLAPRPQEGEPSLAPMLAREDGRIRWADPAKAVHDRVRGVNPWPGGTAVFRGQELRVWRTAVAGAEAGGPGPPGRILEAGKGTLRVACGSGAVELRELQWPGKRRVGAADFLNGSRVKAGEAFE
jgi:methionyl-tRNA formyltransferase